MSNQKSLKEHLKWWGPILAAVWVFFAFYSQHFVKCDEALGIERFNAAFDRMSAQPFDIFPLDFGAIGGITWWFMIGCALLYIEYLRRKRLRTTGEHGTAAWNIDMKKYNRTYTAPKGEPHADRSGGDPHEWEKRNKNIILNNDVFLSVNGRDTMRNLNVLVTGGSGSGKSRFVVKPNLLQANCSFVVTDPKGELLEATGDFLRKRGYKIKVFNLVQMEHSCSYNPFHYIRNEEGVLTMLNALIQNTTDPNAHKGDQFFDNAEKALLQAICFYLYYECNEEDRNFTNVMKLLRCAEVREDQEGYESTLDIMFNNLKAKDPEHIAVRQYAIFKQAAGKTAKSILISCSVRLTVFNMKIIHRLTGHDNLHLESLGDEKTALFCITPVADKAFNFLVAMLYTQLFETLYYHAATNCKGQRLPIHVRFLLDEFANIGTIPEFEQKLSTMRSFEISCTIIIQNLAQLKTMYKESWESITGNCDTFIFLGGQEQSTLKYVSEKLGKETIVTQTDSRNFGSKGGGSSRSKQIIGRDLMMANELAEMDNSECIVFIRGLKPFRGKKYDYPKHPNYEFTGDANSQLVYKAQKEFHTKAVEAHEDRFPAEKKRLRILADKGEARGEDKLERRRMDVNAKPRMKSARGQDLYQQMPIEETFEKMAATITPDEWLEQEMVTFSEGFVPDGLEEFEENEITTTSPLDE